MDLLKNYRVKSPHFLRELHFHIHLCDEMIFTLHKVNKISSHKTMWKCPNSDGWKNVLKNKKKCFVLRL